jgi:hypothetical protein
MSPLNQVLNYLKETTNLGKRPNFLVELGKTDN